ncbi:MAG: CDIF630_02480 family spore surface protein [Caldicoprobacterales bacterium]|jgi:hypothetical protein|nr:DUF3787 domain-containing protein [Clostridiales bacterium]
MAKNIARSKNYRDPIEKHDTAAWANIEGLKPVSRVHLPSEEEVNNAKEYVDSNQK